MRRAALALVAFAGLAAALWPPSPAADATLVPGKPRRVRLREKDDWRARLALDVPEDAIALRVRANSPGAEVLLRADFGELPDDARSSAYEKESDGGIAELSLDRFRGRPLEHGKLWIELAWTGAGAPETSEKRLESLECTLEARVFAAEPGETLAAGSFRESRLEPHASGSRSFRIELPEGAHELRIDLDRVQGDLDLYARPGKPVGAIDAGVRFARHLYGRETLVLGDDEPLGKEPWFLDVVDVNEEEGPVGFRIGVHAGTAVPAELATPAPLPESFPGPFGRALPRVVELFAEESTGSGTLVGPQGWILTNAHVVTAMGGGPQKEVVVACTLDPHEAPLELFRAEVREFDERLDLALLQITKGFYGEALPEGYRFPVIEFGEPGKLAIGEPLLLAGYPSTGTLGSLVTLHLTRGIVAGFDRGAGGLLLKTDAGITGGNSGGAALDEAGRLVGIPTMMVEEASGQAGFVHPWTWMPEAWRKHLAPAEKR